MADHIHDLVVHILWGPSTASVEDKIANSKTLGDGHITGGSMVLDPAAHLDPLSACDSGEKISCSSACGVNGSSNGAIAITEGNDNMADAAPDAAEEKISFAITIINHSITVDGHTSHSMDALKENTISLGFSSESNKAVIRIVEAIHSGESIELTMSNMLSCPHILGGKEAKPEHMESEENSADAIP